VIAAEKIDPYHLWLGIPRERQPPNHYTLLGVELFERQAEAFFFEEEIVSGKPVLAKTELERRFDANVALWGPGEQPSVSDCRSRALSGQFVCHRASAVTCAH
jgi:hypothetical protein